MKYCCNIELNCTNSMYVIFIVSKCHWLPIMCTIIWYYHDLRTSSQGILNKLKGKYIISSSLLSSFRHFLRDFDLLVQCITCAMMFKLCSSCDSELCCTIAMILATFSVIKFCSLYCRNIFCKVGYFSTQYHNF